MKKQKKWLLKTQDETLINEYINENGINEIIARLLYNRGFRSTDEIDEFMNVDISKLHSAFLLWDMDRAAYRIGKAIKSGEKITIYGDYDVDGVTSCAVLYLYIKSKGGEADYYIPAREEEGYGINKGALDRIKEAGTKLIITVDTGITACDETEYAKSIGLELVITDHHECKEVIPDALAVVNPKNPECKYPFSELAGVGVVFKLICALECTYDIDIQNKKEFEERLCDKELICMRTEKICNDYLDIVAIGTIADVMALIGENRIIVSNGLCNIAKTKNIGIKALISAAGIDKNNIKANDIGYNLAPKINAAGRIGSAMRAVELLISTDYNEANIIANELYNENIKRQKTENEIYTKAIQMVEEQNDIINDKSIVLAGDNWNNGVIGIVASKICEKYYLPAILITLEGENGKGSGRSIASFNLYKALEETEEYLEKYGGHELAAGLTIKRENIDAFRKKLAQYANKNITDDMLVPNIEIDCMITSAQINIDFTGKLDILQPCGMANPVPVFELDGAIIKDITMIGSDKHVKLTLDMDGVRFCGLLFNCTYDEFEYETGDRIDIVFNLEINTFRSVESVQAILRDIRLNKKDEDIIKTSKLLYENAIKYISGIDARDEPEDNTDVEKMLSDEIIPVRDDFVAVYRFLLQNKISGNNIYNADLLHRRISNVSGRNIDYFKCAVCLNVFDELGLIKYVLAENEKEIKIDIINTENKIDLSSSEILLKLKRL